MVVNPRLTGSSFQDMVQALSEFHIFTRIGDEYIDHINCPLRLKFQISLSILSRLPYRGKVLGQSEPVMQKVTLHTSYA